jgi:hypothetical protein
MALFHIAERQRWVSFVWACDLADDDATRTHYPTTEPHSTQLNVADHPREYCEDDTLASMNVSNYDSKSPCNVYCH